MAMEATGVYWKPVWHILSDGEFMLILTNAAHIKNVPGRKTDVADALWLADLLAHGLIRPSFVPEAPTQDLRALLRTRKQLVREQASHVQRLQKTLEDANLKLSSVLTQIMGFFGRAILEALVDGEADPDTLLALVQRGVKAPPCKDASPCGIASCCACICGSSTHWPPSSPRSTRRWTATSTLSTRRSTCCGPSRASVT